MNYDALLTTSRLMILGNWRQARCHCEHSIILEKEIYGKKSTTFHLPLGKKGP